MQWHATLRLGPEVHGDEVRARGRRVAVEHDVGHQEQVLRGGEAGHARRVARANRLGLNRFGGVRPYHFRIGREETLQVRDVEAPLVERAEVTAQHLASPWLFPLPLFKYRIMKAQGIPPVPARPTSWETFLRAHWGAIAGADFFTTEVWTWLGLVNVLLRVRH